jgi:hypothetical protein
MFEDNRDCNSEIMESLKIKKKGSNTFLESGPKRQRDGETKPYAIFNRLANIYGKDCYWKSC